MPAIDVSTTLCDVDGSVMMYGEDPLTLRNVITTCMYEKNRGNSTLSAVELLALAESIWPRIRYVEGPLDLTPEEVDIVKKLISCSGCSVIVAGMAIGMLG